VHYKSQPNAKTPIKTQKSTKVKSLTKIVRLQQFSELDRISHSADVVGQSVRLFIHHSTSRNKQHFTREAQFEKDKTTVWIKWPMQGRATYV